MSTASLRERLDVLIARSIEAFNKLTPEEQAALREEQRQSWVRGEMGLRDGRGSRDGGQP
jgi:hypothetical protein